MGPSYQPKYNGMFHALKTILVEEGGQSLWKGIFAGLQRQCIFAGIRIGLYPTVRNFICGKERDIKDITLWQRIVAGLITGAFGIAVASPTDVVKIRLQAEGRKPEGVPKRYNGSIDAYRKIVAEEGVKGLYTGLIPNMLRNSVMNAAELASYDQIKTSIVNKFPNVNPDSKFLHFTCGLSAGFIAVVFASPVDVIKTRVMNVIILLINKYLLISIIRTQKNTVVQFLALLKL
jgi:solute carrier family 25 uncoupling protein 8/9